MASAASARRHPAIGPGLVAVVLAAALSAGLLWWALRDPVLAAGFFAGVVAVGLPLIFLGRGGVMAVQETGPAELDRTLLRAALDGSSDALAVTDPEGSLLS